MTDKNPDETAARVIELRQEGMGVNRIATMLSIGSGRVARILGAAGLREEKREPDQALRDRVLEMRKDNVSVRDISAAIGWSEAFVRRVLGEAGLGGWDANRAIKAKARKPEREIIVAAYSAGESATAIARRLGVRKSLVTDAAKEAGVYREQDRMSSAEREEVLRLRAQGMGGSDIAARIGRSPAAVREWLVKNDLNARIRRPIRIEGDVAYVPLTQGKEAVIDAADVPLIESRSWSAQKVHRRGGVEWYATTGGDSSTLGHQLMHRVIMGNPQGKLIDHGDHDGLNNRRYNLKVTDHRGNGRNARRGRDNGLPRLIRRTRYGKLYAQVTATTKGYDSLEEVVAARDDLLKRIHGADVSITEKFMPEAIDPDTGEVLDG